MREISPGTRPGTAARVPAHRQEQRPGRDAARTLTVRPDLRGRGASAFRTRTEHQGGGERGHRREGTRHGPDPNHERRRVPQLSNAGARVMTMGRAPAAPVESRCAAAFFECETSSLAPWAPDQEDVYQTQFVTRTSNGGLTAYPGGDRWRWEERIFGQVYDDAPPGERPKYGALNHRRRRIGAAPASGPHTCASPKTCWIDAPSPSRTPSSTPPTWRPPTGSIFFG